MPTTSATPVSRVDVGVEFDRQAATLVSLGYAGLAGLSPEEFRTSVAPLRDATLARLGPTADAPAGGRAAFLLVVPRAIVGIEAALALTTLASRSEPGFVDRLYEPGALERFRSTEGIGAPDDRAYVVFDVDRGEEFCGVVPDDAMATIGERGRDLLTIEEGIALLTQYPAALAKNRCFSLGGSRSGDRRVPAVWISRNAPKLGWCWAGNPHTWLGMASAAARTGTGPDPA